MTTTHLFSPPALLNDRRLTLLLHVDREFVHHLAAWAAGRGSLTIIDCSCAFHASRLRELIHLQTINFEAALDRTAIVRPFTAYQLQTALTRLVDGPPPPATGRPLIVIAPLALLYDDNIDRPEAARLLYLLLQTLDQLRRHAPLIVTAANPPAAMADRSFLLERLRQTADRLLEPQGEREEVRQRGLWE